VHKSSIWHIRDCIQRHLAGRAPGTVLEVGCNSKVAECKTLFVEIGWRYVGADLDEGPNVDVVLTDPYAWDFEPGRFDAVVSGSMLEHNELFWLSFMEMYRVLAPGGFMIHVAPSRGYEHWGPRDCWRFYPDSMKALAKWAGFECLEATTDWTAKQLEAVAKSAPARYRRAVKGSRFPNSTWGDTVGVFRKPEGAKRPELALRYARQMLERWGEAVPSPAGGARKASAEAPGKSP
jgi:SAM-dependent methyltransferase